MWERKNMQQCYCMMFTSRNCTFKDDSLYCAHSFLFWPVSLLQRHAGLWTLACRGWASCRVWCLLAWYSHDRWWQTGGAWTNIVWLYLCFFLFDFWVLNCLSTCARFFSYTGFCSCTIEVFDEVPVQRRVVCKLRSGAMNARLGSHVGQLSWKTLWHRTMRQALYRKSKTNHGRKPIMASAWVHGVG